MNFIICDDEKIFLEELSNKIIECLEKQNIDMNIKVCNSGKKLLNICKTLSVDAIFLDIDIPEMNGFQIAKNVRKLYPDCMIIFCSSHNELVYESFEYEPFWFLCKSDYERKLDSVLEKVLKKVKKSKKDFIIKFKEKIIKVRYQEIFYVEVEKHKIRLHLEKEILEYRGNLSDIEKQFVEMGFVKINSGCIVNIEHIFKIQDSELILKNGTLLVISRSNKKNVKTIFFDYLGKE